MRIALPIACAAGLLLPALSAHGDDACRQAPKVSFELTTDWYGGVYVPVRIGDKTVKLLVDTGGTASMLTDSTVASLGLTPQPIRSQRVTMYGGARLTNFVTVPGVQVGPMAASPAMFLVMPDDRIPSELSGTLAPDFLSHYDVEFDFANARMNLFPQDHCPGGAGYWTPHPATVPITLDGAHHVVVPVQIDGKTVMAVLDTGSSRSDLSMETAEELFGLGRDSQGLRPAAGPDITDGLYRYPFKSLGLAGIPIDNPDVVLVPNGVSRRPLTAPRLVLGMGVLRHYHVYIAYGERMLYLTAASAR